MEKIIAGRHMNIQERTKDYINEQLARIETDYEKLTSARVVIDKGKAEFEVEIILHGKKIKYTAKASDRVAAQANTMVTDAGATLTLAPIPHRLDSKLGMAQSLHLTTLLGDLNGESTNRNDRRRKRDRALESAQPKRDRLKRAFVDTLLGRDEAEERRATR